MSMVFSSDPPTPPNPPAPEPIPNARPLLRVLLILGVVLIIGAAVLYFTIGARAVGQATFTAEQPAATLLARLASTPEGTPIAPGITLNRIVSAQDNIVVGEVTFADGRAGRITYTLTPRDDRTSVAINLERETGQSPLKRMQAISGGGSLRSLAQAVAEAASSDFSALPSQGFEGLAYTIEQVAPLNIVGPRVCGSNLGAGSVRDDGVRAGRSLARQFELRTRDTSVVVEEPNSECGRAGVLFEGVRPSLAMGDYFDTTPSGVAVKVRMSRDQYESGAELDQVDALVSAARLETRSTYALSTEDPSALDVFVVVAGDTSTLASILPPGTPTPPPGNALVWCPEVDRRVTRDQCDDYTRLSQSVEAGEAAFNAPNPMQLHETVTLHLIVSYAPGAPAAPPQGAATSTPTTSPAPPPGARPRDVAAQSPGPTQTFTPPVGRYMSAELTGGGFTVKPLSPTSQELTDGDVVTWSWEVTADRAGRRQLFLRTSVDAPGPDGQRIPLRSTTRTQNIEVKVGFWEGLKNFLESVPVWLKLLTGILTALVGLGVAWMKFGDTLKKLFSKKT